MVPTKLIHTWINSTDRSSEFKRAAELVPEIQAKINGKEEEYISWESFTLWMKELRKLGLHREDWEKIGSKFPTISYFNYFSDLSKMVGGVELSYWIGLHWVLPVQFPVIKIESYKQNRDGSIDCELVFHPDVEPVVEIFYTIIGGMRVLPKAFFGDEEATIESDIGHKGARLKVIPSQKTSLIDRVKKTISHIVPMKALTSEFMNLQKQMLTYYSNTAEKEKRLKIMDQMLSASSKLAVLGEAAASIAHEINNPLSTATLLLESVSASLSANNIEQAKAHLDKAKTSLGRISKTVKTIQGFLHQQKREAYAQVSLVSVTNEALALIEQKLLRGSVRIEIDIPESLLLTCEPSQLMHVIVNLVSNAADAIEALQEKWVKIEARMEGDFVIIRVIDSGAGIPDEIRAQMHEPFFTTKPKYKGTGLGLSICKRIIESHGGSIEVDPIFTNTCFVVRVPRQWKQSETDSSKSE